MNALKTLAFSLCLMPALIPSALAHHEIIFGPQSSAMLTADQFMSLQMFSRPDLTFSFL